MFLIISHEEKENLVSSAETTVSHCMGLFSFNFQLSLTWIKQFFSFFLHSIASHI